MTGSKASFADKLLNWYELHGRKTLPWQQSNSLYNIWLSEIMLQQTQVATVIPYYHRFIEQFPDILALANADLDQVLHYWSGLGYYARARNLHKAAQQIRDQYNGRFPTEFAEVLELPGIGRSTAGAILAQGLNQRHPILDGNVKRVLARYFAIEGWTGSIAVADRLWEQAETLTPTQRIAEYTQAIMDLGAMVCTRSRPACGQCPVVEACEAHRQNRKTELPTPKPKRRQPVKTVKMLILINENNEFLLQRRPPAGIWGGLLGFPEIASDADECEWAEQNIGAIKVLETWAVMRHTFSHYHLDITPVIAVLQAERAQIMDEQGWLWYNCETSIGGLAAPVRELMTRLLSLKGEQNAANSALRKTG